MVTHNDTTPPAASATRIGGSLSARLWHFRLMRAPLCARPMPAAPRAAPAARATGAPHAPLSSDARHQAASRNAA